MTHCPRCQGWLMPAQREETEDGACWCGRCVNCGWRVDSVIAAHRLLPGPPTPYADANTPVWDPEGQVLRTIELLHARREAQRRNGR